MRHHQLGPMLFPALFALLPQSAAARDFLCVMDIECFETETCAMTAYGFDLRIDGDTAVIDSDAETMTGVAFAEDGGYILRLGSEIGPVLLTLDPDGFARMSLHQRGAALMVNYTGLCEGLS